MAVIDDVIEDTTQTDALIEESAPVVEQPQVEDLPEKYRGKSAKELALMHQEAEKLIGKQGGEVGELRKIVDDFIKTQSKNEAKKEEEFDESTFFTDPKLAVNTAIENHPSIKEAKQASLAMKQQEVLTKLEAKHPNYMEVAQDQSFVDWIKSSRIRMEMFARAETALDFDAADELLSTWKEKQQLAKQMIDTSKLDKQQQLKSASVSGQSSTEAPSKKIFRRTDIIKLMQTDPNRYEAMQPEIMAAYSEGRVR